MQIARTVASVLLAASVAGCPSENSAPDDQSDPIVATPDLNSPTAVGSPSDTGSSSSAPDSGADTSAATSSEAPFELNGSWRIVGTLGVRCLTIASEAVVTYQPHCEGRIWETWRAMPAVKSFDRVILQFSTLDNFPGPFEASLAGANLTLDLVVQLDGTMQGEFFMEQESDGFISPATYQVVVVPD